MGVNHIDFSINPKVEKKFTLKSFESVGSPVVPMHMALHAIPLQVAIGFNIPLIIWGENPENENGGPKRNSDIEGNKIQKLDHAWMEEFGSNSLCPRRTCCWISS